MKRINYLNGDAIFNKCLIYLFTLLFMFALRINLYPQGLPGNSAGLLEEEASASDYLRIYQIRVGLMPGINLPMGDLGTALGMGFGADLFADGLIPYSPMENLFLRAGFSLGFYSFTTKNDVSASLMMIPFLISGRAVYPVSYGFSPYAGIGLGLTTNMASGDVAKSSYDGTFAINFGTEYQNQSIPQVDFFLDMRYMMAFESITGQFLSVLVGAAYKFDSSGTAAVVPEVKEKPAEGKPAEPKPEYRKSETEKFPPQEEFKLHQ